MSEEDGDELRRGGGRREDGGGWGSEFEMGAAAGGSGLVGGRERFRIWGFPIANRWRNGTWGTLGSALQAGP